MAQTGYTPLLIYASGTASNVPSAANLTSSASGAELALNYADGKLYFKNSSGVVTLLASAAGASGDVVGPASATDNALARFDTTTGKLIQNSVGILSDAGALSGLTDITASGNVTLSGGTANGVAYLNGSKVLTTGSALTYNGSDSFTFSGSSAAAYNSFVVQNTAANGYSRILFNAGASVGAIKYAPGIFFAIGTDSDSLSTPMVFNLGNASEQMRLTSTGLGIGTSSPNSRLHVNSATSNITYSTTGNNNGGTQIGVDAAGLSVVSAFSTNPIRFGNNSGATFAETMRLDSSGNLGLGVTPGAWLSNRRVLAIGGQAVANVNYAAAIGEDAYNMYFTSGVTPIYQVNGPAAVVDFNNSASGGFAWKIAPSGTAGNTISFTQAMTLDASGNLLVGTTSALTSASGRGNVTINGTDAVLAFGNSNSSAGYVYAASTNLEISAASTRYINFLTNNTERARLTSGGDLCVGTTAAISVYGLIHVRGDNKGIAIQDSTDNSYRAIYNQSGTLYFYNGTNEGYLSTAGAWVDASDVRLKENIVPIKHGLDSVMKSQPRSYKMKDGNAEYVGFIAQEMLDVIPECVSGKPEKQLGISYGSLVAVAFKAIQEQQAMIMALKAELDQLKGVH